MLLDGATGPVSANDNIGLHVKDALWPRLSPYEIHTHKRTHTSRNIQFLYIFTHSRIHTTPIHENWRPITHTMRVCVCSQIYAGVQTQSYVEKYSIVQTPCVNKHTHTRTSTHPLINKVTQCGTHTLLQTGYGLSCAFQ